MNQPCLVKSLCFDPANPVTNFSSEAPDQELFIGRSYGYGPFGPRLGSDFTAIGCDTVCEAADPVDALLCAAQSWAQCAAANWPKPDPPIDPSSGLPNPQPSTVYGNSFTTVSGTCPDGSPFFVSVAPNRFSAFSQVLADRMALSYAERLLHTDSVCMSSLSKTEAARGSSFTATVSASGKYRPFTFAVIGGSLPPGLSIASVSSTSARISGTPTATGTYSFTIQATDTHGDFMRKTYSITVLEITTSTPLDDAIVGTDYDVTIELSGPTQAPVSWSVTAGTLPAGLTLDEDTGDISGTPTTSGDSTFTVSASDGIMTATKQFSIHAIVPCPVFQQTLTAPTAAPRFWTYDTVRGNLWGANDTNLTKVTSADVVSNFALTGGFNGQPAYVPAIVGATMATDKIYVPQWNTGSNRLNLYSVDPVTGAGTLVAASTAFVVSTTVNCVYVPSTKKLFVTANVSAGTGTVVVWDLMAGTTVTSVKPANVGHMVYNSNSNVVDAQSLGAAWTNNSTVHTIDPTTAADIGGFSNAQGSCTGLLYFDAPTARVYSPSNTASPFGMTYAGLITGSIITSARPTSSTVNSAKGIFLICIFGGSVRVFKSDTLVENCSSFATGFTFPIITVNPSNNKIYIANPSGTGINVYT